MSSDRPLDKKGLSMKKPTKIRIRTLQQKARLMEEQIAVLKIWVDKYTPKPNDRYTHFYMLPPREQLLFWQKLFSQKRWQKLGWKAEIKDGCLGVWPDNVEDERQVITHILQPPTK